MQTLPEYEKLKHENEIMRDILYQLYMGTWANPDKAYKLIEQINRWGYAFNAGNGELNNTELVEKEFAKFKDILNE